MSGPDRPPLSTAEIHQQLLKEPFNLHPDTIAELTDEQIAFVLFAQPEPPGPRPRGPAKDFREEFVERLVNNGQPRERAEAAFARAFPDYRPAGGDNG